MERKLSIYTLISIVIVACMAVIDGTCVNISSNSICSDIIGTTSVYTSTCEKDLELSMIKDNVYLSLLTSSCRLAVLTYRCASNFRSCASPASLPCNSLCSDITANCGSTSDTMYLNAMSTAISDAFTNCASCTNEGGSGLVRSYGNVINRPKWPRCETYKNDGICTTVINGAQVYVGANLLQTELEDIVVTSVKQLSLLPHNRHNPEESCRNQYLKLMCTVSFPQCDTDVMNRGIGVPLPLPYPKLPCRSECTQLESKCGSDVYEQLVSNGLNCTAGSLEIKTCADTVVVPSVAYFPETTTIFGVVSPPPSGYTGILQSTCEAVSTTRTNDGIDALVTCTSPLVIPTDPDNVNADRWIGSCAIGCGRTVIPKAEYEEIYLMFFIISVLSLTVCAFVLLTFLVFPVSRRKYSTEYALSSFLLTIGLMLPFFWTSRHNSGVPFREIGQAQCLNNAQPVSNTDPYCVFQGSYIHYFIIVSVSIWAFISLHVATKVIPKLSNDYIRYGRILCWLWPIPFVTVGLATQSYTGSEALVAFCASATKQWFADYFYFAPLYVSFAIGCTSLLLITIEGARITWLIGNNTSGTHIHRRGRSQSRQKWLTCFGSIGRYARVYIWLMVMLLIWSIVLALHIELRTNMGKYYDVAAKRIQCVVNGGTNEECKPEFDSVGVFTAIHIACGLVGFIGGASQFRFSYAKLWFYLIMTWSRIQSQRLYKENRGYRRRKVAIMPFNSSDKSNTQHRIEVSCTHSRSSTLAALDIDSFVHTPSLTPPLTPQTPHTPHMDVPMMPITEGNDTAG